MNSSRKSWKKLSNRQKKCRFSQLDSQLEISSEMDGCGLVEIVFPFRTFNLEDISNKTKGYW